jgi:hypothetical protein
MSIAGFRARPLHLHVCQGGTAMGSSVGSSERAYSKRSFYVSLRSTILYVLRQCDANTHVPRRGVGHVSFIYLSSVARSGCIALNERNWVIRQSTDTMRMPLLKGNAISIRSVLFSCKKLDFR